MLIEELEETVVTRAVDEFASHVFSEDVMRKMLPEAVFQNVIDSKEHGRAIDPENADCIAQAMQEWAVFHGATHFCHWFQPLTGEAAEKHDAFLQWDEKKGVVENFTGNDLIRGEPDASSFPSGGLRNTFEARGYTCWDPTSDVFLWKLGETVTLCIPSLFFSWTGDVLDTKIPLLRSDSRLNRVSVEILEMLDIPCTKVFSTLGCEQEYFVIDLDFYNKRPDLVLTGQLVYGAPSAKGQQLGDHYFSPVKERVMIFMQDVEDECLRLGIPIKTRHNEVAPAQHEIAVMHARASVAVNHNIMLMDILRKIAKRHHLACLLKEKPFLHLNGSGKHHNWSLATDTGLNLLDPTDTPENNRHFLVFLTAVIRAVHRHALLLRSSIGGYHNDYRLGGHEAPPAIVSVYLGDALEKLLQDLQEKGAHVGCAIKAISLGLAQISDFMQHNTDRKRTSPFAFTGNTFEFRAVGSSKSPAFPVTILNTIVAESLEVIRDELKEKGVGELISILRRHLSASQDVRFCGDNYSGKWVDEAAKRGLPNVRRSIDAYAIVDSKETVEAFRGILSETELKSRREILTERYEMHLEIEVSLMAELFRTHILPAAMNTLSDMTGESGAQQREKARLSGLIDAAIEAVEKLENKEGDIYALRDVAREAVDRLEKSCSESYWLLPKLREILFVL